MTDKKTTEIRTNISGGVLEVLCSRKIASNVWNIGFPKLLG